MYTDRKKIQLIEDLLKVDNESTLKQVEAILNRSEKKSSRKTKKKSAHEFLGVWTKRETTLIEKAIAEGCEQIDEDGWK